MKCNGSPFMSETVIFNDFWHGLKAMMHLNCSQKVTLMRRKESSAHGATSFGVSTEAENSLQGRPAEKGRKYIAQQS